MSQWRGSAYNGNMTIHVIMMGTAYHFIWWCCWHVRHLCFLEGEVSLCASGMDGQMEHNAHIVHQDMPHEGGDEGHR